MLHKQNTKTKRKVNVARNTYDKKIININKIYFWQAITLLYIYIHVFITQTKYFVLHYRNDNIFPLKFNPNEKNNLTL